MDKEYAPIAGSSDFCKQSIKLALGDHSDIIKNGLVCIIYKIYFLEIWDIDKLNLIFLNIKYK